MECKVFGGDKRDRTADLLNAIQALSQLSYTPKFFNKKDYIILSQKKQAFFLNFLKIFKIRRTAAKRSFSHSAFSSQKAAKAQPQAIRRHTPAQFSPTKGKAFFL